MKIIYSLDGHSFRGDRMDQLPNLGREREMLKEIGLETMDDLFSDIPEEVRRNETGGR